MKVKYTSKILTGRRTRAQALRNYCGTDNKPGICSQTLGNARNITKAGIGPYEVCGDALRLGELCLEHDIGRAQAVLFSRDPSAGLGRATAMLCYSNKLLYAGARKSRAVQTNQRATPRDGFHNSRGVAEAHALELMLCYATFAPCLHYEEARPKDICGDRPCGKGEWDFRPQYPAGDFKGLGDVVGCGPSGCFQPVHLPPGKGKDVTSELLRGPTHGNQGVVRQVSSLLGAALPKLLR